MWTGLGLNLGLHSGRPATNCLNQGGGGGGGGEV